ncbi:hypothetical protein JM80_3301 [Cellulophaga sp. RHA_52]|uniref:hypothetical protein n=1 Tax=Cellulophaga sp. RHA_52 TaxID=1250036 RepID=UPI0011995B60|nr:hypothetical protein [Cellulophaga sp. RHA_52]TVZ10748.1 hypothetical protein JM80_3301 [Cellulophaga sp. RHA_52]
MKPKYLFLLVFSFLTLLSSAQNKKLLLEKTIANIVTAFKEKNATTINNYVSKEKGIIILVRYGVLDNFTTIDSINFEKPTPSYLPYAEPKSIAKINYNNLPKFNCSDYSWSKKGLFCDTLKANKLFYNTVKNLKYEFTSKKYKKELKRALDLEKNSCKVILVDENDEDLIFNLVYSNKKWLLTIIDRVTTDCSA